MSSSSASSLGSLAPSGPYVVSSIALEPIEYCHKGTGAHTTTKYVVDPATVPGTGPLAFVSRNVGVRTLLFQLDANEKPNWFGVAVPDGITDFTRPILYFHPFANPPRYVESAYFGKQKDAASRTPEESRWRELFEYVDRLGHQLAAASQHFGGSKDQVVILPFMPPSAMNTGGGVLPAHWLSIVTDILIQTRAAVTGVVAPLAVSNVVLAGYSAGFSCLAEFRRRASAAVLGPLLTQIWDFDGFPKSVSIPVVSTPAVKVVKYAEVAQPGAILVPRPRWSAFPAAPPDEEPELPTPVDTQYAHHLIRDFMFLHAALQR